MNWHHIFGLVAISLLAYAVVVDTEVHGMKTPPRRARLRGLVSALGTAGIVLALVS